MPQGSRSGSGWKTKGIRGGRVTELRRELARLMVEVNLVEPKLAELHVFAMDDQEVSFRMQVFARDGFAGMELSAVGPPSSSGSAVSTRFLRPETATAGGRHSTAFPKFAAASCQSRGKETGTAGGRKIVAGREVGREPFRG
jgi:hypothetical protein